jgi:muramoyltetrapeptide carboxypeptidase
MDAQVIAPKRLTSGMCIGLVTTSFPVSGTLVEKSTSYLNSLGFRVRTAEHALGRFGFMAATADDRAADIMNMFTDPTIDAIFVNHGGRTAHHVLDRLDYDVIRAHPKIFMAHSDPTVIANAIAARSDLITFHGLTGYNFGEGGVTAFSESAMLRALTDAAALGEVSFLHHPEVLRSVGSPVSGRLFGGHLLTTRALLGTPYQPDWSEAVLMLEDCFEELHKFDDGLMHFRLAGVLDRIRALLIGLPVDVEERSYETTERMQDVVLRICDGYDFPILYGMDIGHTDDKVTLPIGAVVEMDSQRGTLSVPSPVLT